MTPPAAMQGTEFRCPFCGMVVTSDEAEDGVRVVEHELPTCEPFETNDADEFIELCRKRAMEAPN